MDSASFVLQASIALALVAILTAATALAVSRCLKRQGDVDSLFWYAFSGLLAVVAAIIGAAATIPGSAALVTVGALLCAGVAVGWLWRGEHERRARLTRDAEHSAREALRTRHERVLQQWVTYELDPAAAIDFPAMTDLSRSDTARFIRTMRAAALLRDRLDDDDGGADVAEYETAVGNLEAALVAAEAAAGVTGSGRR